MNWLTNFVKPKLSALVKRKEVPENLWNNCPNCGNMIHHKDLKDNFRVCTSCNYHFRMSAEDRIKFLFNDEDSKEIELDILPDDPLNFSDKKKYKDRLKEYRKKTNRNDAFILIEGKLNGSISEFISGENGFGYDPVFVPKDVNFDELNSQGIEIKGVSEEALTLAAIPSWKELHSHRAKAANQAVKFFKERFAKR